MRALLDAQLSPEIARLLRARRLDVDAVTARADIPDSASAPLIGLAAAEGRAVVTSNVKDFRQIAARRLQRGQGHAGLILIPAARRRTKGSTAALADAIERVMRAHPDGVADTERWI